MKKIIYSLVIMIAAGSLFTSCVENTEPQGIRDLREAKADYLASLSKLREADAEKVKAEAAYVQAQTATEQARAALTQASAALEQARAEAAEIANDKAEADNAIALEKAQAEAEVYLAKQEKLLAEAEEALRAYLVKVAEEAKTLTLDEQIIITKYVTAYNNLIAKQAEVRAAEEKLYNASYNLQGEGNVEAAKARYEAAAVSYAAAAAQAQALYDYYAEMKEDEVGRYEVWAAEYQKLQDSLTGYQYLAADLDKEKGVYEVEHRESFNSFYSSIEKQQKTVAEAVAKTAFSFSKEYALPADTLDVVKVFKANIQNIIPANTVTSPSANKMKVDGSSSNVKTAIYGSEAKPDSSLAGIIDALKRDSVVTDQLVKDTAGLAVAVAKIDSTYKAVKDTLEAGIAEWKGIKDALTKAAEVAGKPAAARAQHTQDTAALFESIRNFIDVWNEIAGTDGKILATETTRGQKYNDSLDIFNALKSIMEERTKVFNKDAKFGIYVSSRSGQKTKDSVLFSQIDFKDLQDGTFNQTADATGRNGFLALLNEAFGTENLFNTKVTKISGNPEKLKITKISVEYIKGTGSPQTQSVLFEKLFFGDWWVEGEHTVYGEIYAAGAPSANTTFAKKYCEKAVTDSTNAAKAVNTAKDKYYNDFYCKFWGLDYNTVYDATNHKLKTPADSLKIRYTEKTYTDPYLIPVFEFQAGAFKPANGNTPASFDPAKVTLKSTLELETVEGFVGKNIKNANGVYTLYAQTLYAGKFEKIAKTWKENSKALAELDAVVEKVKADYTAKVNSVAAAQTAADSVVTAVLGEDIVKKALKDSGKKHATELYDGSTLQNAYFVKYAAASRNIDQFCKNGKFTFGGQQLAAAESYIPDYAAKSNEWTVKKEAMDVAKNNCTDLAKIVADYVKAIQTIEQYTQGANPIDQVDKIKDDFNVMLTSIKNRITTNEQLAAQAIGSLKKLDAGYDPTQVAIENAEDALAKAQQALENAEVEYEIAKAAYEAVLAAHGITE